MKQSQTGGMRKPHWLPALLWGVAALSAASAQAQTQSDTTGPETPTSGWYIEASGGAGWLAGTRLNNGVSATKSTYKAGFGAGMSAGYDFGRWRLEGEYLYQTNDAEVGDFSSVVVSANLIGEWNLFRSERAQSYAGVGLAWLQEVDLDFETPDGERSFSTSDIAVQAFAGVEYTLSKRWSAALEARYLAAGKLDLKQEGGEGVISADYDRTSVLLSIRRRF